MENTFDAQLEDLQNTELMMEHLAETRKHIGKVRELLRVFCDELEGRAQVHDASKLDDPDATIFAEVTPDLRGTTYGSDEYKALLQRLGPALEHHYANNSHHPEHYEEGINGMDLFDVVEMFCDWKAATLRHDDGDMTKSLTINQKRFGISPQLAQIFQNTIDNYDQFA